MSLVDGAVLADEDTQRRRFPKQWRARGWPNTCRASIRGYVEALGGTVDVIARVGDWTIKVA